MIEAGYDATALQGYSPAKLVWLHNWKKSSEIKSEIRWLLTASAAAHTGANGGDAAEKRFKHLQTELKQVCNDVEKAELDAPPVSQTPRSTEEFEAMMAEQ